jgi:hypothetical protein
MMVTMLPSANQVETFSGTPAFSFAKSTSSKGQVFTNRGKADDQEAAAKRAKAADRRRAAACVAAIDRVGEGGTDGVEKRNGLSSASAGLPWAGSGAFTGAWA